MSSDSEQSDYFNFPAELRDHRQWCNWSFVPKAKNPTEFDKVPFQSLSPRFRCDKTEPKHWAFFDEAVRCVRDLTNKMSGIGYCIYLGVLALDLDNCLVNDEPERWALGLIRDFEPTYIERTPSKRGVRVIWLIDPADAPEKSFKVLFAPHTGAEILVKGSYITVTGDAWGRLLPIAKLPRTQISDLVTRVLALKKLSPATPSTPSPGKIQDGKRHDHLNSFGCKLIAAGASREVVRAALFAENRENLEHPHVDSEVNRVVDGLASFTAKQAREALKPSRKLFLKISKSIAEVPAEVLTWLWHNIILAGALNLFVGLPDVGKTLVCIFIIAALTTGRPFPFSKKIFRARKVLVICREDSYARMWVPRLLAAGADLSMVVPVHGVSVEGNEEILNWYLDEPEHLAVLRDALLADPEIGLCVIDPLADMLGHRDMNKADDIRAVMGPLNKVAQETMVAMVVLVHTTKALIDSVIKSAAGSIQLMAAVQVSWLFIEDSDVKGQRLMLQGRNKSGKKRGFKYWIESAPWPAECGDRDLEEGEEDDGVGMVVFKAKTDTDANDILQRKLDRDEPKNKLIRKWLLELLARGPVPNKHCNEEAQSRGFTRDYVSQVCAQLGVIRNGKTWMLPDNESETKSTQEQQLKIEGDESSWKRQ